ncbi:uncharacterized protein LOC105662835 [Megachile rotundata]|uniref:uncharacterized protein LOC105662835 n=1 Tax=Megachile rotundata TaxID=143995 RepID=UPI000614B052|nr:PREDICTED: transcription factor Adf-1-like [Megachile rotundata]
MSGKFQFSSEEDEMLIECIRNYPVLYDISDKDYKNYLVKENVWREISTKLGRSPTDCKKRWRNIRDTFMKIKRGNKYGIGSAAKPKSKWPLLQHLSFLDIVFSERSNMEDSQETSEITSNIDSEHTLIEALVETSIDSFTETDSQGYIIPSRKRRLETVNSSTTKRHKYEIDKIVEVLEYRVLEIEKIIENINRTIIEDSDPVTSFFKSMATTVKTFPPDLIAEAKLEVLRIINVLEKKSLH